MIIGISGPSASGKSTVAQAVGDLCGDATIIQQDWYYMSSSECPPDANFCELRWLHADALVRDLTSLVRNGVASVPVVDFGTFERVDTMEVRAAPLIIVEGMTILRIEEIVDLLNWKFYVAIDMATIATRKRERDLTTRKKSPEIIEEQLRWVAEEYVKDAVIRAREDVVVLDGSGTPHSIALSIVEAIRDGVVIDSGRDAGAPSG